MLARQQYNRANAYLTKEILEATPQKLLVKIYDYTIVHCKKGNMLKTNNGIQELINGLNFDLEEAKDITSGLLMLYQFCQDQMRKGNNDVVCEILTTLKETWISAFNKETLKV